MPIIPGLQRKGLSMAVGDRPLIVKLKTERRP